MPAVPAVLVVPATHPLLSWHRLTLPCTLSLQLLLPCTLTAALHTLQPHNEEMWDLHPIVQCPLVPSECQLPGLPTSGTT